MPWGARPKPRRPDAGRRAEDGEIIPPGDADPLARFRELFEAARRSGRVTPRPRDGLRSPEPMGPLPGAQLLGCLFRALLLIFVIFVLITIAGIALVGGSLMEMIGPLLFELTREF
jgi:hypothetical protein